MVVCLRYILRRTVCSLASKKGHHKKTGHDVLIKRAVYAAVLDKCRSRRVCNIVDGEEGVVWEVGGLDAFVSPLAIRREQDFKGESFKDFE